MEEENLVERMRQILAYTGMNSSAFADRCGISRATLSQLMTGRNKKISAQMVGLIHQAFPEINVMWLLFGEEEMLNNKYDSSSSGSTACQHPVNAEKPKSTANGPSVGHRSILSGVNSVDKTTLFDANQGVNMKETERRLMLEIEELRRKVRKVVSITIYYDDNTFETFHPGK